jgi:hypothetical protein
VIQKLRDENMDIEEEEDVASFLGWGSYWKEWIQWMEPSS